MKPRMFEVFSVLGTLLVCLSPGAQPALQHLAGGDSVLAAPVPRPLSDAPWTTNVTVNDNAGTTYEQGPSIAVDPDGNAYATWQSYRNGNNDIYFSYRPAGGCLLYTSPSPRDRS